MTTAPRQADAHRAGPAPGRPGLARLACERGAATVEFVIVFPVFILVFLASFEASLVLTRQVMLERGVDMAAREIRLGGPETVDPAAMAARVCDEAMILPDCYANMIIELQEVSMTTWALPSTAQPCVDRGAGITPTPAWVANPTDRLVVMRACFATDPFMPTSGLGSQLVSSIDGASVRMVAATTFMVEP
jgi:hypothetical protein